MTENEIIDFLEDEINGLKEQKYGDLGEIAAEVFKEINGDERIKVFRMAISALKEVQQYRKIGTVEECKKAVKEEDALKFYYCESEDNYYIGKRVGNFYYARYGETGFEWFMSRYLPWGEHVIAPNTVWKEYTYPSEPKKIPFFEWLQGFIKRYCGGTVKECREAVEKQKPKPCEFYGDEEDGKLLCPNCGEDLWDLKECGFNNCPYCGQAIQWDENLEGMEDE